MENVPARNDWASGIVYEPGFNEGEPDTGINKYEIIYLYYPTSFVLLYLIPNVNGILMETTSDFFESTIFLKL